SLALRLLAPRGVWAAADGLVRLIGAVLLLSLAPTRQTSAAVVVSEPGFTVTTFSISTVSGIISGLAPSPGGEFGSDLYVALGLGSIVRVDPSSGSVTPFATGLTNIDGLAFDPGTFETGLLYVSRNDGSISTVSAARVVSLFTKGGTLNSSN